MLKREPLEQTLVALWREVFRLNHVGRDDNFFELGGNSLVAMELMDKISGSLDHQIPVVTLYQNPSPRELAHCISTLESHERSGLEKTAQTGSDSLS